MADKPKRLNLVALHLVHIWQEQERREVGIQRLVLDDKRLAFDLVTGLD